MYSANKIFDITNREVYEIANDCIKTKLKRDYSIVEQSAKKNKNLNHLKVEIRVKDNYEREYVFTFYFSDYFMEFFVKMDSRIESFKESTDENIQIMDIVLTAYARRFGLDFAEEFLDVQKQKEDKRFETQKKEANTNELYIQAKVDHKHNILKLDELRTAVSKRLQGLKT